MTPLDALNLMKLADNYAKVAVKVHSAKMKAQRTGDKIRSLDQKRIAARDKLVSFLQQTSKKEV